MIDPKQVAEWVHDARSRTLELVGDLSDDQMVGPILPIVNPLIWEIGHLSWFQERFVLRDALGRPPIVDHADAIWDSGTVPHDTRWRLELPSREETVRYCEEVRDRVVEEVLRPEVPDVIVYLALFSAYHDDMHTEAITYTRQTLGYPPPRLEGAQEPAGGGGALPGDAEVPGGEWLLGATGAEPFVFDCEKWCHPVHLEPFRVARAPVTQGDFAAFVDDGGYRRRELWSEDGWAWRARAGAERPVYWRGDGSGGWERRHFDAWVPLEADRAMVHVTWYEADAYCRWAGRRLPTEAEWEMACLHGVPAPRPGAKARFPWGEELPEPGRARVDWQGMGSGEVGAEAAGESPVGCRQMIGNVWEWTASTFLPYPNFQRDPYADNSEPWFGQRKVLRGGAWATRGRFLRATYRNYFPPDRRDVLAGFRTAALEG